jgi:hypothetical protein
VEQAVQRRDAIGSHEGEQFHPLEAETVKGAHVALGDGAEQLAVGVEQPGGRRSVVGLGHVGDELPVG